MSTQTDFTHPYAHYAQNSCATHEPNLVISGLWIRLAFVGASVFVGGTIAATSGEVNGLFGLLGALAGGVLAAFAWRRARACLDRIDAAGPPRAGNLALRDQPPLSPTVEFDAENRSCA
ncbi:MAG TPA: hypothetical protein VFR86_07780 [Burkholderiaceae bacterium]|nr:hypothetical protein [Burkholderiaceae bacterium]